MRKRPHVKTSEMESYSQSKLLKKNYYEILDIDSEFQCEESILSQFSSHVQKNKNNEFTIPTTSKENESPQSADIATTSSTRITKTTNQKNNNLTKIANKQSTTPIEKVPPINIFNINPNELIKFIQNGLKIIDFSIKDYFSRNKKVILYLKTIADFIRVKSYLEKTESKFFTYTPKCIKPKSMLLKGLSSDVDENLIYSELDKINNDQLEFIKVSKYYTNRSKHEGYELPIFLVQLSPESNLNQLKSIQGLLHRRIRWEPLRKPEIPQCRNCQGFFHSAANCQLARRCVKCNESHSQGECKISNVSKDERDKIYCVLCNKFGHPASYRGCEKYKELQNKLRSKRISLQNNPNKNLATINPNISYSNIVSNGNKQTSDITTNSILNELKSAFQNISTQIVNLQKQLELQSKRIDTLFSIIES